MMGPSRGFFLVFFLCHCWCVSPFFPPCRAELGFAGVNVLLFVLDSSWWEYRRRLPMKFHEIVCMPNSTICERMRAHMLYTSCVQRTIHQHGRLFLTCRVENHRLVTRESPVAVFFVHGFREKEQPESHRHPPPPLLCCEETVTHPSSRIILVIV